ncbi:hypothetical protein ACWEKT_07970 [Nocardia takedensis]
MARWHGGGASRWRWMAGRIAMAAAAIGVLVAAGCADSPEQQSAREDRAAGIGLFELHMPERVWERTNFRMGGSEVDEPQSLTPEPEGMSRIELTGAQMVDYLGALDHNAHGGFGARDPELATTVYDIVAGAIDRLQVPPPPGQPTPRIDVPASVAESIAPTE